MVDGSRGCQVAGSAGGEVSMGLQAARSPGLLVERFTNRQVDRLMSQ